MRNSLIVCALAVLAAMGGALHGQATAAARQADPRAHARPVPAADPRRYAAADTAFGLEVLAAWCRQEPQANIVFSPESLSNGLGMALLGARGRTAAAMARTLRLQSAGAVASAQGAGPARAGFVAGLRGRLSLLRGLGGPGVAVLDSDRVWADPRLRLEPSYLNNVATAFRSQVGRVPLTANPAAARRIINTMIGQQTRGEITDLLSRGSVKGAGWVLTDAIYLDADWARPFDHARTAAASFTTAAGRTVRPQYLHGVGDYRYADADGWTAVALPYLGGRLALIALRADSGATSCPALPPSRLNRVVRMLAPSSLGLAMPAVRLTTKADMAGLLTSLGMGVAFGPDANFRGLSPNAGALGLVEHAATLRVDEKGTVAAAATGVAVVGVSIMVPHRDVVFDRPICCSSGTCRPGSRCSSPGWPTRRAGERPAPDRLARTAPPPRRSLCCRGQPTLPDASTSRGSPARCCGAIRSGTRQSVQSGFNCRLATTTIRCAGSPPFT